MANMYADSIAAIVIAGTGSGVGKTSLTLGLIAALRRRGLRVQPFKVGPDFLDPTYLSLAAGCACYNLDTWMTSTEYVQALFRRAATAADIAVIEGVMGMFDGADPESSDGSTAALAACLGAPVLLVVNVHGTARSVAATVKGFVTLEPELRPGVAGVLANHCGSERHAALLTAALRSAGLPELVGAMPRGALPPLKSRHLGLQSAQWQQALPDTMLTELAVAVEKHVDLDLVLHLARQRLPPINSALPLPHVHDEMPRVKLRIGYAADEAFHFYYPDNLDALRAAGAELVAFSPLTDTALPPNLQALYIGGGYPEEHAAQLTANTAMRREIAAFAAGGGAVYAECGGLMYLGTALETRDGARLPMCNVLPVETRMRERLRTLGYTEVALRTSGIWGAAGTTLRGHEFHYSELVPGSEARLDADGWERAYEIRYRRGGAPVWEGFQKGRVLASYVHAQFAADPRLAAQFVQWCSTRA